MNKNLLSKKEIESFQIKRNVISLYKNFLVLLEDLEQEHIDHFNKLYKNFEKDKEIINQADYFSENKMSYLRKKVLDLGNDCIRSIIGEHYD